MYSRTMSAEAHAGRGKHVLRIPHTYTSTAAGKGMTARIIRSDHIWPCSSDHVCGRMGRATSLPRIFTDRTLRCLVDIACSGTGRGDGRDQPEKHVRQSPWGAGLGRRRTSGLGDPFLGKGEVQTHEGGSWGGRVPSRLKTSCPADVSVRPAEGVVRLFLLWWVRG